MTFPSDYEPVLMTIAGVAVSLGLRPIQDCPKPVLVLDGFERERGARRVEVPGQIGTRATSSASLNSGGMVQRFDPSDRQEPPFLQASEGRIGWWELFGPGPRHQRLTY